MTLISICVVLGLYFICERSMHTSIRDQLCATNNNSIDLSRSAPTIFVSVFGGTILQLYITKQSPSLALGELDWEKFYSTWLLFSTSPDGIIGRESSRVGLHVTHTPCGIPLVPSLFTLISVLSRRNRFTSVNNRERRQTIWPRGIKMRKNLR